MMRLGFFYILISTSLHLWSQSAYLPLNYELRSFNEASQSKAYLDSNTRYSSFHPNMYSEKHADGEYYNKYVPQNAKDSSFLVRKKYKERSGVYRKLFLEHLIIIDTGQLYITIDPLFNFSGGSEASEDIGPSPGLGPDPTKKSIYNNTRGLNIRMDIGKKFSMESYFYENQSIFPSYIDSFVQVTDAVPGQGRVKEFKEEGFDFSQAGAYFSYAPWKNFNLQFGHHKHFIGDGYRSLMLSDNAFNYPFLRLNLWLLKNRISYSVMYTSFQNLDRIPTASSSEAPFRRKAGSFHNIDVFASKWLKFNLFQGMIWKTMDQNAKSDINYDMFNPIIFFNPAKYGLDDENNAVLGIGYKADVGKKLDFYGQFIVNDNEFDKKGYQLGVAYFPAKNVRLMFEWNKVTPYTYSSSVDSNQSYMHYNQPLAHPLQTGFEEYITKVDYRYKRFVMNAQISVAVFEENGQKINEDNNIIVYVPGSNNSVQKNGLYRTNWTYAKLELSYIINPATNFKIFVNATRRIMSYEGNLENQYDPLAELSSTFFYFGIRTDLRNIYNDF